MRLETHISSKHNGCMNDYFVILNGQDMTAVCITWIGSNTNTGPGVCKTNTGNNFDDKSMSCSSLFLT